VHPSRSFGKRFEEIGSTAKANPDLLRSPNRPMPWDLPLARIRQAAALTAPEYWSTAPVQYRDALPAGFVADGRCTTEPGTYTAEVASRPRDGYALGTPCPLARPHSLPLKQHGIGLGADADAPPPPRLLARGPGGVRMPSQSRQSAPRDPLAGADAHRTTPPLIPYFAQDSADANT
jgi:hypothetical protein